MIRTLLFQLMILSFAVTVTFAQNGRDWSHPDGNSERTAYVSTKMSPPFKYTTVDVGVDISCFSLYDDVLYIANRSQDGHKFLAFDLKTEKKLWEFKISESTASIGFCPTISEDLVYVGTQRGPGIYALDRLTGDSVWLFPSGSQFGRHVAVKNDLLFAHPGGVNDGLVVFDKDNGDVQWQFGVSGAQTVPLVDDMNVYYTTRLNDTIYALSHDGILQWKHETIAEIDDFEATMSKGDTFFIKTRKELTALNKVTGQEYWTTMLPDTFSFISTLNALTWSPHGIISHEWIGDWRDSFKVRSFDQITGQINWTHDLNPSSGAPCTAFGDYLINSNGGGVEIREAKTGNIVQDFPGLNVDDYGRIVVTDGQIMAKRNSEVLIFTPILSSSNKLFKNKWQIINNPVGETLYLNYTNAEKPQEDVVYRVLDMQGRETASSGIMTFENGRYAVPMSQVAAGTYLLVLGDNGELGSEIFIKN